jgi:hypothetical protein
MAYKSVRVGGDAAKARGERREARGETYQFCELICHTPMSNEPSVFSLAALALPLLSAEMMHWQQPALQSSYSEHIAPISTGFGLSPHGQPSAQSPDGQLPPQ